MTRMQNSIFLWIALLVGLVACHPPGHPAHHVESDYSNDKESGPSSDKKAPSGPQEAAGSFAESDLQKVTEQGNFKGAPGNRGGDDWYDRGDSRRYNDWNDRGDSRRYNDWNDRGDSRRYNDWRGRDDGRDDWRDGPRDRDYDRPWRSRYGGDGMSFVPLLGKMLLSQQSEVSDLGRQLGNRQFRIFNRPRYYDGGYGDW